MALKILIAEDDKDLVDLYRTIFEGRGHEVMITNNGMDCQNVYKRYTKQPMEKLNHILM
ncbi:MAG: hypothetical protein KGI11_08110 [Thaumarchaeota archaeon]|nr:hypothetical protein [Nitrososphaerota archaeon]